MKDTGKSSSRKLRRVIYYTLYRMDPQTTQYKNSCSATFIKIPNFRKLGGKAVYIPPLTPDQPPFKGGYLCYFGRVFVQYVDIPCQMVYVFSLLSRRSAARAL